MIFLRSVISVSILLFACDPIARQVTMSPAEEPLDARVLSVSASGSEESYSFSVELSSPDTGCDQYADWWEVMSDSGTLIYRRILTHSHVNEQPFTRSGSPVPITADQTVWVRAHMNNTGYSSMGAKGSVNLGFELVRVDSALGNGLELLEPLPDGCAF